MKMPLRDDACAAAAVVTGAVLLALVSKSARSDRARAPQVTRAARDLLKQALTWADMSAQDQELIYKMQHATLAAAYCNAARVLATDDELMRATNVDVHAKLRELEATQRKVVQKVSRIPGLSGSSKRPAKGQAISSASVTTWM